MPPPLPLPLPLPSPLPHPSPYQLILADEDMALEVGSILVSGALRAGGPDCRLAARLTLTFRSLPGIDPLNMVGEGWAAAGGQPLQQGSRGVHARQQQRGSGHGSGPAERPTPALLAVPCSHLLGRPRRRCG